VYSRAALLALQPAATPRCVRARSRDTLTTAHGAADASACALACLRLRRRACASAGRPSWRATQRRRLSCRRRRRRRRRQQQPQRHCRRRCRHRHRYHHRPGRAATAPLRCWRCATRRRVPRACLARRRCAAAPLRRCAFSAQRGVSLSLSDAPVCVIVIRLRLLC
jgi:hypothetical protein